MVLNEFRLAYGLALIVGALILAYRWGFDNGKRAERKRRRGNTYMR